MKESDVKKGIEDFLQLQQNLGKLVFNRLNSGSLLAVYGGRNYKVNLCQTGTPDYIVHKEGFTVYFEVKRPKGQLSPEQVAFHAELEKHGIPVATVESVEEVASWLNIEL